MGSHSPPSPGAAVMGMRLGMLPSLGFIIVVVIMVIILILIRIIVISTIRGTVVVAVCAFRSGLVAVKMGTESYRPSIANTQKKKGHKRCNIKDTTIC